MEHFADAMTVTYNKVTLIPNWLLYVMTGAFGSFIISILHRNSPQTPAKPTIPPKSKAAVSSSSQTIPTTPAASSNPDAKRAGAKMKKSGKK